MATVEMASPSVCRTCMSDAADLHYIFFELKIMERTLPEIINYVAEIKVDENDELPNYICGQCINLAKSALLFKEQCQRSDATFKEIISVNCYTEKTSIKKEVEQCVADVSNFHLCQNNIKVESDMQDNYGRISRNFQKIKMKSTESDYNIADKSYDPYQCAVCNLRFSFCNQLEDHVKELHRFDENPSSEMDQSNSICSEEAAMKYTCETCHKHFGEKRKLSSHLQRCENRKRRKEMANEMIDAENVSGRDSAEGSIADDFKHEDAASDDSLDTFLKRSKIKTEPEIVITTPEELGVSYMDIDRKAMRHANLDNKDSKHFKKSKSLKKANGISKKDKHRKKLGHHDKEILGGLPEDFYEEKPECDEEIKSEVPYSCSMCERKFRKLLTLNMHLKKHEEQLSKVYTCQQCKREFQRKGHLDNHILTHSSEKGFACSICPKAFARQDSLSIHIANHKGLKKHQCNFCEKGFNVLSTLKDHIRTHTGEKPFLCSICGRGFSQSTNLKEHVRRHQGYKPFKCVHCEQTFVSKGELEAHTRKHSGAHPFVCDVCGGGFTTSSSLVKHKRIHTGERPYQCDFCTMRFTALGTLKNHRRRHTGEKPYKCIYCDKAFAQKNDLVSHTRTHTGERPFVCTVCGHAFRQSSALKTHFKIHGSQPDHDPLKMEKRALKIVETPLTVEAIQLVTNLMAGKECTDDNSSVNIMTPKSETSH